MKRSTSLRIPDSPKVTSSYPGTPRTASSTPEKSDKQLNVCTLPILKYGLRSPIALPSEDTADDLHKSISTEIETLNPLESKETIISTLKKNHSDTAITKKRAYLISQDNSALNIFFGNNHPEIEIKHNLKEDRIWCAGSMIACQDNALIITDQSGRFPHSDLSKLEKLLGQLVGKFSIAYIPFQDYAPSVCTAKVPQFMKLLHIMKGGIATFKELLHPDSPISLQKKHILPLLTIVFNAMKDSV